MAEPKWTHKRDLIAVLKTDGLQLAHADVHLASDPEVVAYAVAQNPAALAHSRVPAYTWRELAEITGQKFLDTPEKVVPEQWPLIIQSLLDYRLRAEVLKGDKDAVREALADGANVNARDRINNTPLFDATLHEDIDVMSVLIQAGADVNATNAHWRTPLYFATGEKGARAAGMLLAAGADMEICSPAQKFAQEAGIPSRSIRPLAYELQGADYLRGVKDGTIPYPTRASFDEHGLDLNWAKRDQALAALGTPTPIVADGELQSRVVKPSLKRE